MNGANVNKLAADMRHELIDPKTQKMRFWIDDVNRQMSETLDNKIKRLPFVHHTEKG
jgi:hypothetical protein